MIGRHALILAVASLITILPLALLPVAGDWMQQAAFIQCFGDQFWQGDLYPRWCFNVNDGLGAPFFLFYFPLPFYVSTLLYPLTWLGVGIYPLFIMCCFLATLVTALAAYGWLKDIVAPKFAVPAAILLLLVPYRMELLLYRMAYAELWAVALLPLLFSSLRKLALGELRQWLRLAWLWGALALTHLPVFCAAAAGSAVYMIVIAKGRLALLLRYGLSIICGGLTAAFFIIPAGYYKQYIFGNDKNWSLDFLSTSNQMPILTMMLFLSIFSLIAAALWLIIKRRRLDDSLVRRETFAWCAVLAACLFLVFPVSGFFHTWLGPINQIVPPRRMQALLIPCTGYFAAVILAYFSSRRKNWKSDYGILVAFLLLASYGVTGVPAEESVALLARVIRVQCSIYAPFRPRWVDWDHWSIEYVMQHVEKKPPRVAILAGSGDAKAERWRWDGITLSTRGDQPMRLKLDHMYFPVWQAVADGKTRLTLLPEQGSGLMLLDVPAGTHHILLRPSIFAERPQLMRLSWMVSLMTALALLFFLLPQGERGKK